jgi:hypothetical protein
MNFDGRIVEILDKCLSEPQFRPSLKDIRKSFTDLLNPPMYISLRFPTDDSFRLRTVLAKNGVIYIGDNNRYTNMHKISELNVE